MVQDRLKKTEALHRKELKKYAIIKHEYELLKAKYGDI